MYSQIRPIFIFGNSCFIIDLINIMNEKMVTFQIKFPWCIEAKRVMLNVQVKKMYTFRCLDLFMSVQRFIIIIKSKWHRQMWLQMIRVVERCSMYACRVRVDTGRIALSLGASLPLLP